MHSPENEHDHLLRLLSLHKNKEYGITSFSQVFFFLKLSTFSPNEKCEIMNKKRFLFSHSPRNEEVNNFFVSKKVLTYEQKRRRSAIFQALKLGDKN